MKYGVLATMLVCWLTLAAAQSGRVRRDKEPEPEKLPSGAGLPLPMDASRPVLVNMSPEDFQACGLNKLTEDEMDHLDRWILDLFTKLQSLPPGRTLQVETPGEDQSRRQELKLEQQRLQAQVMDLQSRLLSVSQEANRMSFDLHQARLSASRGDWGGVQSALLGIESSVRRIQRASQ